MAITLQFLSAHATRSIGAMLIAAAVVACGGGGGGGKKHATSDLFEPYGLTAAAQDGAIELSWPRIAHATAYNLYWSTTPGVTTANATKIAGVAAPYQHAGLSNGTVYYYAYTVETAAGESALSREVALVPQAAASGVARNVHVHAGDGRVEVWWNGVANASAYRVYWKAARGVNTADHRVDDATAPTVITGLQNGTAYHVVVTALVGGVESALSAEAAGLPYAPEPLPPSGVAAQSGDGRITLEWNAAAGAVSYALLWSDDDAAPAGANRIDNVISPYVHTGLGNGTLYRYALVALNATGTSAPSAEVGARPAASASVAPQNLRARAGDGQVSLNWAPVAGAGSYNLRWRVGEVTQVIDNVTPPYTHVGLSAGSPVYYTVSAVAGSTEGPASAEVFATPVRAPARPRRVQARFGHNQITLDAASADDALRYDVYWNSGGNVGSDDARIANVMLPYTHLGLSDGATYHYRVVALNEEGASALSDEASAAPNNETLNVIPAGKLRDCVDAAAAANGWSYTREADQIECIGPEVAGAYAIDISGIGKLGNLGVLNLNGSNSISAGFGELAQLRNLAQLGLARSGLTSLATITDLKNLTLLILYDNGVTDLTSLPELTELTSLDLGKNGLTSADVAPLASMPQLQYLYLDESSLTTLTSLAGLTQLIDLSLWSNQVTNDDLDELAGLTRLSRLWLSRNPVSDISALQPLSALTELYLDDTDVTNLSPISAFPQLRVLWAARGSGGTKLSDANLAPLANRASIVELGLDGNNIGDVTTIGTLANLQVLSLNAIPALGNVEPLQNLKGLTHLSLSNSSNLIVDAVWARELTNLTYLNLDATSVSNLSVLSPLTALQELHLSGNAITDVAPLAGLTNLTSLWLDNNQVGDVDPLKHLTRMEFLSLRNNGALQRVDTLKTLKQAKGIMLFGNPAMDCLELLNLIVGNNDGLGSPPVDLDDDPLTSDSPVSPTNCTN